MEVTRLLLVYSRIMLAIADHSKVPEPRVFLQISIPYKQLLDSNNEYLNTLLLCIRKSFAKGLSLLDTRCFFLSMYQVTFFLFCTKYVEKEKREYCFIMSN